MTDTQGKFGPLEHWARRGGRLTLLVAALTLAACAQVPPSQASSALSGVRSANASDAGMSAQRLELLTAAFNKEIADKALPGAVIMVARKGQLVYAKAFGLRDPAKPDAMEADSIFRIYSMTKPMASVAAMILVEEGRLQLSDPVFKHLPAFKDLKAYTANGTGTEPARPMTVQDLLRHTSGLGYGEISNNAAFKEALTQAGLCKPGDIDFDARDLSPAEQVTRLAAVPLLRQPGTAWEYSLSTDVLGRVIEAASGQRLGDFMAERIFKPLGMKDTAFHVPEAKSSRLAASFDKDPATFVRNAKVGKFEKM